MIASPTQASPRISSSASWPEANREPSRTASRMSPNTNRSPSAVPASPTASSGSPVTRPLAKFPMIASRAGGGGVRGLDLGDQRRLDRHLPVAGELEKAVGEIGVVGGERGFDLARGHLRHPTCARRRDRRAPPDRPGRRSASPSFEGKRHQGERGDRHGHRQPQRHGDPRSGHRTRLLPHQRHLVIHIPAGKIARRKNPHCSLMPTLRYGQCREAPGRRRRRKCGK